MPSAPWARVHRAEEDAHTMTLAGQSASDWAPLVFPELAADSSPAIRAGVEITDPMVLTLTF